MDVDHVCSVCLSLYTSSTKKKIDCSYCNRSTCFQCLKKCTLMWASQPKCPSCMKAMTSDTLENIFPKSFRRGELRIQAMKNLQEQEISLLPQSSLVLLEQKKEEEFILLQKQLKSIILQMNLSICSKPTDSIEPFIEQIETTRMKIKETGISTEKKKEVERKTVKCPNAECRGYILKSGPGSNVCGLCQLKLCNHCNAIKTENDHSCNPDDVASWKLIRDSTVPCPKCGTNIEKISGCNQMWCTVKECETAFDWTTGKIINGPIHNPHYHQWLAEGGTTVNHVNLNLACANPRDIFTHQNFVFLYNQLDAMSKLPEMILEYSKARQFIRVLPEVPEFGGANLVYGPSTHEKLRFDYLENKISKNEWLSKLSARETLRIKHSRISSLNDMFRAASGDIFSELFSEIRKMSLLEDGGARIFYNQIHHGQRTIPIVPTKAKTALEHLKKFNESLETLRIYHIKEMCRILSDYSDKSAQVLYYAKRADSTYLTWGMVKIDALKLENCLD